MRALRSNAKHKMHNDGAALLRCVQSPHRIMHDETPKQASWPTATDECGRKCEVSAVEQQREHLDQAANGELGLKMALLPLHIDGRTPLRYTNLAFSATFDVSPDKRQGRPSKMTAHVR